MDKDRDTILVQNPKCQCGVVIWNQPKRTLCPECLIADLRKQLAESEAERDAYSHHVYNVVALLSNKAHGPKSLKKKEPPEPTWIGPLRKHAFDTFQQLGKAKSKVAELMATGISAVRELQTELAASEATVAGLRGVIELCHKALKYANFNPNARSYIVAMKAIHTLDEPVKEVAGLREALFNALSEMEKWRDSDICDCDGNGHTCGLPRLNQSIEQASKALARPAKEVTDET